MKLILWLSIALVNALDPVKCVDCNFFKKKFLQDPRFGKCSFFPKEVDHGDVFVTGKSDTRIENEYCTVARQFDTLCGNNARYFQKR
jgi:hypothetical protein